MMLIALFLFTSFFYYIPMTVLAAIIEVSIINMVDFQSMRDAYKIDKRDCFVMVITFLVTFFVGVIDGLFVGIFFSFAVVMKGVAFPHVVHLGKLPEDEGGHFKDVDRFPEAVQIPGFAIVRMDASPFFGNSNHFKDIIMSASEGAFHTSREPIRVVILDASAWIDIDLSGIQILKEVIHDLQQAGNKILSIACAKGIIRDILRKNGLSSLLFTMSIDDSITGKSAKRSRRTIEDLSITLPQVTLTTTTNALHSQRAKYKEIGPQDELGGFADDDQFF
eukprot:gene8711-6263_t